MQQQYYSDCISKLFMLTVTNVIVQVDVLETILQSVLEPKPGPESSEETKESEQKSQCAETEETEEREQSKVPEYYSRFKVRNFHLCKYYKL